jgi:hypothetical protein
LENYLKKQEAAQPESKMVIVPQHIIDLTKDIENMEKPKQTLSQYLQPPHLKIEGPASKSERRGTAGVSCNELHTMRQMFR